MADLSNVPPEVMQILTHDPPYSPGEKAILQSYILRADANPVVLRAFQMMGEMPGDSAGPFHTDLRYPGANPNNQVGRMPEAPQTGPFGWTLDGVGDLFSPVTTSPGADRAPSSNPESNFIPDLGGMGLPDGSFMNGVGDFFSPLAVSPGPDVGSAMESSDPSAYSPFPSSGGNTATASRRPSPVEPSSFSNTQLGQRIPRGASGDPLTAAFTAQDGTPAGSNTQTQGTPGTTDWKSQAEFLDYPDLSIGPESAFFGINSGQISRVASNPEFMADYLYPDAPLTQAGQTEWLTNVKMLADLGLLSNTPNATIFDKPESNITKLQLVEQLKNSMPEFNSEIDPRAIYREAFTRILNSDPETFDYGEGGVAGDAENQVMVTNSMLSSVKPFITASSQETYMQRLNRAGMQYLSEVAASGTSLSYPEWLQQNGAADWM